MADPIDPRVLFSAERTLLAWNRTTISLIGLGFVIERFGLFVEVLHPNVVPGQREVSFLLGLALIFPAIVINVASAVQYRRLVRWLPPDEMPMGYKNWMGPAVSVAMALVGTVLMAYLSRGFR